MKIGIIGQGYVGTAVRTVFQKHYNIETFDKVEETLKTSEEALEKEKEALEILNENIEILDQKGEDSGLVKAELIKRTHAYEQANAQLNGVRAVINNLDIQAYMDYSPEQKRIIKAVGTINRIKGDEEFPINKFAYFNKEKYLIFPRDLKT